MQKSIFFSVLFFAASLVGAQSLPGQPLLHQIKNKDGKTILSMLPALYKGKVLIKETHCYYFEKRLDGGTSEFEIDKCRYGFLQQQVLTADDRQNGVEYRGNIWIEGETFRERPLGGEWSESKPIDALTGVHWMYRNGYEFKMQHGVFSFTPTKGADRISSKYIFSRKAKSETESTDN